MVLNQVEQQIERSIFNSNSERTSIDKVMGRNDIERIQKLMAKPQLSREDILVLMAYMSGMEAKLFNLSQTERGVLLKYFAWISEYVKVGELNHDLQMNIEKDFKDKDDEISKQIMEVIKKNESKIEHIFKAQANLYLNIARTSLSQSGSAFKQVLEHKYDIQYNVKNHQIPVGGQ